MTDTDKTRVYEVFKRSHDKIWGPVYKEKNSADIAKQIEQRVWNAYKVFDRSYDKFWGPVCHEKTPSSMAKRIEQSVWRMAGVIKATAGLEGLGYWMCQFSILCEDVQNARSHSRACELIEEFRRRAKCGLEYQRPPEDQRSVFNSEKWRSARDSMQVRP